MNTDIITKYNISATICGKVYNTLKSIIILNEERNIQKLTTFGNNMILTELDLIYKNNKNKNIAFPISISLNNILSNYSYDTNNHASVYNNIQENDIIKIELGVSLDGCISILAETFTINNHKVAGKVDDTINILNNIQKKILNLIKHGETVDEIRCHIEAECSENNIFPPPNCTSYQQHHSYLKTNNSKYMLLNYKPIYDIDDILITPENINFEFEEHDIFTINLTTIINEDMTKYSILQEPHLYNINDNFVNFKLNSTRTLYNKIKQQHQNYVFNINEYFNDKKNKIGLNDCINKNILDDFPIIITKNNPLIVTKKFTIIVGKHKSKVLLYKLN